MPLLKDCKIVKQNCRIVKRDEAHCAHDNVDSEHNEIFSEKTLSLILPRIRLLFAESVRLTYDVRYRLTLTDMAATNKSDFFCGPS